MRRGGEEGNERERWEWRRREGGMKGIKRTGRRGGERRGGEKSG